MLDEMERCIQARLLYEYIFWQELQRLQPITLGTNKCSIQSLHRIPYAQKGWKRIIRSFCKQLVEKPIKGICNII